MMTTAVAGKLAAPPHCLDEKQVANDLDVTLLRGLSVDEVVERRAQHGENKLAEPPRVPAWKRYIAQFKDLLILILLSAALLSFVVSGELKTPIVVLIVVIANATIGFIQENRAEASLEALRKMLTTNARVRRNGSIVEVTTAELVPGDIVLVEAGDRVPADGRLSLAANLEIEESALTGESHPSEKGTAAVARVDAPLGDRSNMAYKNTTVTRGRGEFVVTATGMNTEIGRIAGLLRATNVERTPLQKQLDDLAHHLAVLAGVIVALVFIIGLLSGDSFGQLFLTAVALAVAAIPEGLPAVTVVTLALGVSRMAKKNAIVKRLASVETLGCTNVVCSDKTGTLTLNQMTARSLIIQNREHSVTGQGYSYEGRIDCHDDDEPFTFTTAFTAMALCSDAVIGTNDDGDPQPVGDPTELALVVLAEKGGISVNGTRQRHPRISEVPFDSATKYMATVHSMPNDRGESMIRMYVKGAPDVLIARSTHAIGSTGAAEDMELVRDEFTGHNDALAHRGLRVLAVAERVFTSADWHEFVDNGGSPADLVHDLTLLALIGIMDPPRPEAKEAIAEARSAGIDVKMITGDHAVTAAAIGRELGLSTQGEVQSITGSQLDQMDDDELDRRIDDVTVFARVAPEHKIRLVSALQRKGRVVAMTGDGVNDAPALKKADMGVAMGITGTEVTKEASTMVLTDDNFATIIRAVKEGRVLYDNIVKFVRFQLSTTLGFATIFLFASAFNIAGRKPFTAIAILWVNIIMDGPPAMALGVDPGDDDIMKRSPRPLTERILTRPRWTAVGLAAVTMAVGTLLVLLWAPGEDPRAGVATISGTMAFNTFVLFQFFNILNTRSDSRSTFSRSTFTNKWLWSSLAVVILLQVAVTHASFMQSLFETTDITTAQWLVCVAVASSILWVEEMRKFVVRTTMRKGNHV